MVQTLASGIHLGAQYVMIALGLTLIFALTDLLNFAHRQMYVLRGFVTQTFYGQLGCPFVLAPLMSCITLAVMGALVEKCQFGPVIRRSAPVKARPSAKTVNPGRRCTWHRFLDGRGSRHQAEFSSSVGISRRRRFQIPRQCLRFQAAGKLPKVPGPR